jgi:hypothetical protein
MTPTLILVRPGLPPAAGLALLEAPHALRATTETVASPTNIDVLIDRFMRHSIVAGTSVRDANECSPDGTRTREYPSRKLG